MPGWTDPYEPDRTYRGPGEAWSSPGRHPAERPEWSAAAPDEYGRWPATPQSGYDVEPGGHRYDPDSQPGGYGEYAGGYGGYRDGYGGYGDGSGGYARDGGYDTPWAYEAEPTVTPDGAYLAAGGDLPGSTRDAPRRPRKRLVLVAVAAAATLLTIVGIAGLLLPPDDEGVPTAAGESSATDPAGATASTAPAVPPQRTAPPASRASAPAAKPSTAVAPSAPGKRKGNPAPHGAGTSPTSATQAQQVVSLVNEERADAGCDPLDVDSRLTTAARLHSEDQAEHQNMSHAGSDGSTLAQRIDRVGYEWRAIGENVAYGQSTPTQVMDAWMDSDGHRRNILNCQFEDIGVGIARDSDGRLYWTQVFGA